MKRFKFTLLIALLTTIGVVGCAREKKELAGPGNGFGPGGSGWPTPPNCTTSGCPSPTPNPLGCAPAPTPYQDGSTVTLNLDSGARLRDYVGTPLNNPGSVELHVNLKPYTVRINNVDYKTFGGDMNIRFADDQGTNACPVYHNGSFTAGYGQKVFDNGNQSYDTKYNQWNAPITSNLTGPRATGKLRVFLEDLTNGSAPQNYPNSPPIGGVIFIVDYADDNGKMSGSVWYYNFKAVSTAPPTFCWFVYDGPYDCRDFGINPTAAGKYQRLGTFSNLERQKALNE